MLLWMDELLVSPLIPARALILVPRSEHEWGLGDLSVLLYKGYEVLHMSQGYCLRQYEQ